MNSKNQIPYASAQLALAMFAGFLTFVAPKMPDRGFVAICLALVAMSLAVVLVAKRSEGKPGSWFTADVLFSVSFSVIHFAYVAYWLAGYFPQGEEIWYFRNAHCPDAVNSATAMFVCSLCSFLFGFYLLGNRRQRSLITQLPINGHLRQQWGAFGRLLVRLGFLCFAGYVVLVGPAVVFGEYAGTHVHGFLPNIFFQLGMVTLVAGIAATVSSNQESFDRNLHAKRRIFGLGAVDLLLVLMAVFAIGLHGDRSTLLFIVVAIFLASNEYRKPVTLKFCGFLLVALVFALGFIGTFRASESDATLGVTDNVNAALVQFGRSALCGFVAVDYVPEHHDYYYGRLQILGAAGLVPFARSIMGLVESPDSSSSKLMTLLIQGRTDDGVSGAGTSIFADFYLDFGFLPTIAIFVALGVLSKFIQNRARGSASLRWQIAFVCYGALIATVSRYAFLGGFVRQVLYAVLYASVIAALLRVPMAVSTARSSADRPRWKGRHNLAIGRRKHRV